jgi:hypothetical protein
MKKQLRRLPGEVGKKVFNRIALSAPSKAKRRRAGATLHEMAWEALVRGPRRSAASLYRVLRAL